MDLDKAKVESQTLRQLTVSLYRQTASPQWSGLIFRQAEVTFYTSPTFNQDSQLSSEPVWV